MTAQQQASDPYTRALTRALRRTIAIIRLTEAMKKADPHGDYLKGHHHLFASRVVDELEGIK